MILHYYSELTTSPWEKRSYVIKFKIYDCEYIAQEISKKLIFLVTFLDFELHKSAKLFN